MTTIFLVRVHLNPGDEFILTAYTDEDKAESHAARLRKKTRTRNYDVVAVEEGKERHE